MAAIETEKLGKIYENGTLGLKDLSLEIKEGEIFGFLGPNGSGKTTTVRLLNGTLHPSTGSSRVLGIESSDEELRTQTASLAEEARMYEQLTVEENLDFFGTLYGMDRAGIRSRSRELLESMGLYERRGEKLAAYSSGMKKRVQLIRCLLHSPRILFLDEPSSGLDPESSLQVTDLISSLASEHGNTVFLCTHNLPLAERICTSFGFLKEGKLCAKGSREELVASLMKKKKVGIRTIEAEYEYEIDDETEINRYARNLMDRGEHIIDIQLKMPSLEEVYFHYIGFAERKEGEQ